MATSSRSSGWLPEDTRASHACVAPLPSSARRAPGTDLFRLLRSSG
jgi:hypothetical protein